MKRGLPSPQGGKCGRSKEIKCISPLTVTALRDPFTLEISTSKCWGQGLRKIIYPITRLTPGLSPFSCRCLFPPLLTRALLTLHSPVHGKSVTHSAIKVLWIVKTKYVKPNLHGVSWNKQKMLSGFRAQAVLKRKSSFFNPLT